MKEGEHRVLVKALITLNGKILIGKKEDNQNHPIGGEWHIIGGHLEKGEEIEDAVKREVKEETGLEVEVHQVIDIMSFSWNKNSETDSVQIVFHCEAKSLAAEAKSDLEEVKWVKPSNITEYVHTEEAERIENREKQKNFIEKLEKMPF